ncbi:MAG: thioesterase family protein [Bacteroidota bacterium]
MLDLSLSDFPQQTYDKLRYSDTDRQGHVNNAVFATFLETGRVELLYLDEMKAVLGEPNFVIASLQLAFRREITWPGTVEIGTGILRIGNSSITLHQQLFQHEQCVSAAESIIVQVNAESGKSMALSEEAKQVLTTWNVS